MELTRLFRGEIEPTELQELPVMRKSSQGSSLGEDRQSRDGPDPWNAPQPLIILVAGKEFIGPLFDGGSQLAQGEELAQHETKHGDGLRVFFGRKTNGRLRGEINISQNALFSDLAANEIPGFPNELVS